MAGLLSLTRRDLLASGAATLAMKALPAQARAPALKPIEIAGGVWMLEGARASFSPANGGHIANVGIIETDEGAVIIDTGATLAFGEALRALAEQRFGGVAQVIITHHHPDHWFGTQTFSDRPVGALPHTIDQAKDNGQTYSDALYMSIGAAMRGTKPFVPTRRLAPGDLVIGKRALRLMALKGHTGADLTVADVRTGTLITGDLAFLERAPSLPDADIGAWLKSLVAIEAFSPATVLPGHGPADREGAAVAQTRAYLEDFDIRMRAAAESGMSAVEALAAGPAPQFANLGANPEEFRRSVLQTFRQYEAVALPAL